MNNQQKNIGLLVGFLITLFVVYNFAIKNTFEVKNKYSNLLKEKQLLNNATNRTIYLTQKNNFLDSILKSKNVSLKNSFQQTLLQKITSFSEEKKIEVLAFDEPHEFIEKNTTITTFSFEVKGDFSTLLKLINHIEQQQLGELISIHFKKKKNYSKNRIYLTAAIFLQKIKNN
ncbi:hypothetical protein [Tenacibaculum halocynthiae]|uniref:hypothetical protein n=1 Tax=Tenacibaculum halocynthiae TaxID=1254437 RepID=UPI003895C4EF